MHVRLSSEKAVTIRLTPLLSESIRLIHVSICGWPCAAIKEKAVTTVLDSCHRWLYQTHGHLRLANVVMYVRLSREKAVTIRLRPLLSEFIRIMHVYFWLAMCGPQGKGGDYSIRLMPPMALLD